ncbi:MAG: ABC transporter permease subunit [DPANN group archaeon]|nr:ABC transporter permease subunit [DPANN group archaeon]
MSELKRFGVLLKKDLLDSIKDKKAIIALLIFLLTLYGSMSLADNINEELHEKDIEPSLYDDVERTFGSLDVFIPFVLSIFLLPLVALIMAFDSIAAQRENNNVRYYLLKVRRVTFLVSKVFSNFIILVIVFGLFFLISNIVLYYKLGYSFNLESFFYPWTLLSVYSLALISFYTFLSSIPKTTVVALMLCFAGLLFLVFTLSTPYLKWLSMFSYLSNFMKSTAKEKFFNYLGLSVYAVVFFVLSWIKLERTDL